MTSTIYYAAGEGLGHVARACRVLKTLNLTDSATIVTDNAVAACSGLANGIDIIVSAGEDRANALTELVAATGAARLFIDAFPKGIRGELAGLQNAGAELCYVARRLRWTAYCDSVGLPNRTYAVTYRVEPLEEAHELWVRAHSGEVVDLDLRRSAENVPSTETPCWVVVHSGPESEIRELTQFAQELAESVHERPRMLLLSQLEADLPAGFERAAEDASASLFATAERIVSAAGFNTMLETEPWRAKHFVLPFPRKFDDQYARAAARRQRMQRES